MTFKIYWTWGVMSDTEDINFIHFSKLYEEMILTRLYLQTKITLTNCNHTNKQKLYQQTKIISSN